MHTKLCPIVFIYAILLLFSAGCTSQDNPTREKVLLISIDGFMPEYMEKFETPSLDYLAEEGVLADYMIPVFPTKTFPNHYSIVTGLYTENSGVISNNMYDAKMDEYFSLGNRDAVTNPDWYGGEPIWVTAEKQGVRAATMFWPGSEAPIQETYATRWMPYDDDLGYTARVDSIISWLQVADETNPGFLTLYFSKVDNYGHRYGTESDSVRAAVEEVDTHLGYLVDELQRIGEWGSVNILITSDHGMANVSDERVIVLDEIIDPGDVEIIDWSPVAMIRPKNNAEQIYEALKSAENHYRVYLKDKIPEAYHVKNHSRVPEIMMIADIGYIITTRSFLDERNIRGATHGYDNRAPEMRSFFLAAGPSIQKNIQIPAFQSIHLYELMAWLLNVEPAPNDGDLDSLRHILR
ncbi:MAG: nucleotide pyrophosphatase/phosphodiesterase family protein [Balneolaceae bacterium]